MQSEASILRDLFEKEKAKREALIADIISVRDGKYGALPLAALAKLNELIIGDYK